MSGGSDDTLLPAVKKLVDDIALVGGMAALPDDKMQKWTKYLGDQKGNTKLFCQVFAVGLQFSAAGQKHVALQLCDLGGIGFIKVITEADRDSSHLERAAKRAVASFTAQPGAPPPKSAPLDKPAARGVGLGRRKR